MAQQDRSTGANGQDADLTKVRYLAYLMRPNTALGIACLLAHHPVRRSRSCLKASRQPLLWRSTLPLLKQRLNRCLLRPNRTKTRTTPPPPLRQPNSPSILLTRPSHDRLAHCTRPLGTTLDWVGLITLVMARLWQACLVARQRYQAALSTAVFPSCTPSRPRDSAMVLCSRSRHAQEAASPQRRSVGLGTPQCRHRGYHLQLAIYHLTAHRQSWA